MDRRGVLVGLSAVGFAAVRSMASAQQKLQTIRLAVTPTEDKTNLMYGIKSGIFSKAGVELDVFWTNSGSAAATAVFSGSYDLASSSLLALFSAHLRNVPLVIVEGENAYYASSPSQLLQVAADSKLRTAPDLNGKTFGVPGLNDINSVAIKAWVDKSGGDYRSLKFVEVPNSALVDAIVAHRIDAALVQYPALGLSLAEHTTKTIGDALGAIAPHYLQGIYFSRPEWVAQNSGLLKRFIGAYEEATEYTNTHFAQTATYTAELTGITPEQAQKMRRTINPTSAMPSLIQPVIDAAAKYGAIQRVFKAEELL